MLLAFDTAGPLCAVALARPSGDGVDILAAAEERLGRGHAERLMPMIEAALGEANVRFGDLTRIAVTVGPGSFTGVRAGVAAARGLALALGIRAVGVGSLEALAYAVRRAHRTGTVVATFDARRGEVYAHIEDIVSARALAGPAAFNPAALAARLADVSRPLMLTGSGAPLLAPLLPTAEVVLVGAADHPDIADVAALGLSGDASHAPVPLYARAADAKPQLGAVARL